jgi:hypothetical protein
MNYYAPTIRSNSYNVKVYNETYTLTDNETKNGFVFFRDGITIPRYKTLTLDTPARISGQINCIGGIDYPDEDSGILKLGGDLVFGSDVSMPDNKYLRINGDGHVLHLSGDFAPSTGGTLSLAGDTIIDGHGNALALTETSDLVLEANTTVTLRNMIIKIGTFSRGMDSILSCASDDSTRLCLENVTLELNQDYAFEYGRLYISGNVTVRGPSTFTYNSIVPMNIHSNSMLTFDVGTTFKYNPGGSSTNTDYSLFTMTDLTSVLYLNGATFDGPACGPELLKGTLIFGNKVTFKNYTDTTNTRYNTDAFNGITLGNGENGLDDVNVYLLSGARVEVEGYLDYLQSDRG